MTQFKELRLYAGPFETGKVGDEISDFLASQGVREGGRHGGAFVDAVFDCFDGDLADFAGGEVANPNDAFVCRGYVAGQCSAVVCEDGRHLEAFLDLTLRPDDRLDNQFQLQARGDGGQVRSLGECVDRCRHILHVMAGGAVGERRQKHLLPLQRGSVLCSA